MPRVFRPVHSARLCGTLDVVGVGQMVRQLTETELLAGRYQLLDPVGRGGMSVVRRARDTVVQRLLAVKIPREPYANDCALHRRLLREGQVAMRLAHPCVVRTYDYGKGIRRGASGAFIAMELLRGTTLQTRLATGPLPPTTAISVAAQIASALAAIHAAGIVHYDVKPSNIMLTDDGVKVFDFGIAADAHPEARSRSGEILGTPAYVGPERLIGDVVGPPADIYALGILLYRLLAGRAPWQVGTTMQMLTAHVCAPPAPLPVADGVPASVAELCHRCLDKNPSTRPDAHEAEALLVQGATTNARPSAPIGSAIPRPPHRRLTPEDEVVNTCPISTSAS